VALSNDFPQAGMELLFSNTPRLVAPQVPLRLRKQVFVFAAPCLRIAEDTGSYSRILLIVRPPPCGGLLEGVQGFSLNPLFIDIFGKYL